MRDARARPVLLALGAIGLQVVLALLLARIYLSSQNTLHNNGRWRSTKTTVSRALIGAVSFVNERQALARNSLDLSAWHGYQEVLLADELAIDSLALDFRLEAGARIAVFLDKPDGKNASTLRFGTLQKTPSAWLEATTEGEFVARQPINPWRVDAGRWHHLELEYAPARAEVTLDGEPIGSFALPERSLRRIGFRGATKQTLVDEVEIRSEGRVVLREGFNEPRRGGRIRLTLVAGILAANLLLYVPLRSLAVRRGRAVGFAYAMISVTSITIAALVLGFLSLRGRSYPLADDLKTVEEQTRKTEVRRIRAEVQSRYGGAPAAPGVRRILLVGSSQTWGSGAAREEHVWSTVLESRLNADPSLAGRFECINTGISSARAAHLRKALEKQWLALRPETVVINLGINDTNLETFEAEIGRMVAASRAEGADPVLLLEPSSPDLGAVALESRHAILRRIGEQRDVPVIDMQAFLRTRRDDGFLWWDFAHLTSFGQRLFAERLHEELKRLGLVD